MRAIYLAFFLLALGFSVQAQDDLPAFLADPVGVDPDFPPRMWTGKIESGDADFNYIAYLADGEGPHPTAILLHGFPGNEKNLDLAQALRRVGWNAVFINFRGTWGSLGEYSVENANEDVKNAISYLQNPENVKKMRVETEKIVLIGHSFGGFNAFYGAANFEGVSCVVGMAASDIGHHVRRVERGERDYWPWIRERDIIKGYSREIAIEEFTRNKNAFFVMNFGAKLKGTPTLIITPEFDGKISVERQKETAKRFEEAGVDVTLEIIEGADHSFSARRIALMTAITNWLNGTCLKKN